MPSKKRIVAAILGRTVTTALESFSKNPSSFIKIITVVGVPKLIRHIDDLPG